MQRAAIDPARELGIGLRAACARARVAVTVMNALIRDLGARMRVERGFREVGRRDQAPLAQAACGVRRASGW